MIILASENNFHFVAARERGEKLLVNHLVVYKEDVFIFFSHVFIFVVVVNRVNEIKKHYKLAQINWKGDPCSPREYSWKGLTCDNSKNTQNPRIVSV
jgi:hypothetical protein